jgi:hypothetical protein
MQVFSQHFIAVLETLGIDPTKDGEIYHMRVWRLASMTTRDGFTLLATCTSPVTFRL